MLNYSRHPNDSMLSRNMAGTFDPDVDVANMGIVAEYFRSLDKKIQFPELFFNCRDQYHLRNVLFRKNERKLNQDPPHICIPSNRLSRMYF